MPIKVTPSKVVNGSCVSDPENVRFEHEGRVARIVKKMENRNCSDTLDYSDFRTVETTKALVYLGRHNVPPYSNGYVGYSGDKARDLEPDERFAYVDCTNLFAWRGSDVRSPEVDPREAWQQGMAGDLADWDQAQERAARELERRQQEAERLDRSHREEEARNRPVKGKRMVVASGRKVPVGTEGTVAFTDGDRVLLKADHEWENRKANGTWVQACHLKAR